MINWYLHRLSQRRTCMLPISMASQGLMSQSNGVLQVVQKDSEPGRSGSSYGRDLGSGSGRGTQDQINIRCSWKSRVKRFLADLTATVNRTRCGCHHEEPHVSRNVIARRDREPIDPTVFRRESGHGY